MPRNAALPRWESCKRAGRGRGSMSKLFGTASDMVRGIFFAVITCCIWGVLPLYWHFLEQAVNPFHLLGVRILLSFLVLAITSLATRNFNWTKILKNPRQICVVIPAAILLCSNWALYLWAIAQGRVVETSLGYYITPLISVTLGLIFLKERLTRIQSVAFGLACAGVLLLTVLSGALPWISILIAVTFGLYGLLKKKVSASSLESLTAELLAAAPLGILLLLVQPDAPGGIAIAGSFQGVWYITTLGAGMLVPLALAGALTAFPLYCFGNSVRLLPLSVLGFFQFITPTLQFSMGVFVLGEFFPARYYAAFAIIWFAAALNIVSLSKRPR